MMENRIEERTTAELFGEYTSLLWQWSWLLILLALVAGGTAYFLSNRGTRIYQASTLVMFGGTAGNQVDSYTASLIGQQMAETYARVMVTQPVLNGVAMKLGLEKFPPTASIQVQPITSTDLLNVVVQDVDPDRAALLANTLVSVFTDQIQADQNFRYSDTMKSLESQMASINQNIQDSTDAITLLSQKNQEASNALAAINDQIQNDTRTLASQDTIEADNSKRDQLETTIIQYQTQLAQLHTTQNQFQQSYNSLFQSLQSVKLSVAQNTSLFVQKDPAIPNSNPVQPQPLRNALLAAVIGLILAASVIFFIEYLSDTIRDPQQITQKWGIPILGMIVSYNTSKGGELISVRYPRSPVSEAFRTLRTNLQFASVDTPIRTMLVTSPSASEGKTTIIANLASVIAQSGRNVVIVDADLRRPQIHKLFQLSNRVGLTDQFIQMQDRFDGALKSTEIPNLHAITSGNLPPNPSELLGSGKMSEILDHLSSQFNTVMLDTPPSLLVTDALVLASRVDGVLLVVKPSVTKWAALKQVIEQLQHNKANLLGVVINDVNINRSGYYYYRGYYQHKFGKGSHYYAEEDVPVPDAKPKAIVSDSAVPRSSLLQNIKTKAKK